MRPYALLVIIVVLFSCSNKTQKNKPNNTFNPVSVQPDTFFLRSFSNNQIVHRGVFNPSSDLFYFTLSDTLFQKFDIYFLDVKEESLKEPIEAPFNSAYSDHGLSFSSDGETAYFSSTRPTGRNDVLDTWHIWRSTLNNGIWSEPEFIDIPNMKQKLLSHPSMTNEGDLYFHASEPDYSNMDIYSCIYKDGKISNAIRLEVGSSNQSRTTPYVSSMGDYLLYAEVNEDLDLYISRKKDDGWSKGLKLSETVNVRGKGNPYVVEGELYYTVGDNKGSDWKIMKVDLEKVME